MKKLILFFIAVFFIGVMHAQYVGVGTIAPVAKLEIRGVYTNPAIPNTTSTGIVRYSAATSDAIDIGKMGAPSFAGWIQSGYLGAADPLSLQPMGGNVGIGTGTSVPDAKLHINGTIKIVDGTQGAGKVLTSNASGQASWQSPSSPPPSEINNSSVSICCQRWMTKNLDVATYRNGDPIPKVTNNATWGSLTTGAYCYYNNDSTTYAATYGKLYNWYAVNDPRGLAPEGWYIPTDFEWTTLENCLGGGNEIVGGPMKEIGTVHWTTPNNGATNISGFTGLPGGYRSFDGSFNGVGDYGLWWSFTAIDMVYAWNRGIEYSTTYLYRTANPKNIGISVRCLKD